jgi:NhaA family Na+:H+ antiporter
MAPNPAPDPDEVIPGLAGASGVGATRHPRRQVATWLPETWSGAVVRLVRTEAAGGVALAATVAVALVWANVAGGSYAAVWDRAAHVPAFPEQFFATVGQWVENGVMVVFFFAVGLEIGRERACGSLRDNRNALLPVMAALGGMAGAAIVYLATVAGWGGSRAALQGWGVPMATDVAFVLAAMALLGPRVPSALRVFVLALAVADDLASVVVLAVVSSSGFRPWPLAGAAACFLVTGILRSRGVAAWWPYVAAVIGLSWLLAWAGVEPTLAGAFVGALVPCAPGGRRPAGPVRTTRGWVGTSGRLEAVASPLATFVAVPLFALASTGVVLHSALFASPGPRTVLVGVVTARLLGKMGGITLAVLAVVYLGRTALPADVRWSQVVGASVMCGMGFTVPLLFAGVTLRGHPELVAASQLGLLLGTVLALACGATVLVLASRKARPPSPSGPVMATRPPNRG